MQEKRIYQVGGSVRDELINQIHGTSYISHDKDWLAVGYTKEEIEAMGFQSVGKAFPVFLHPVTGEELALARKEITTGPGHKDFEFLFTPDITLEEDTLRRDFTMNAIAKSGYELRMKDGIPEFYDTGKYEYIDLHNGIEDIRNKVIRITDPNYFIQDPLRILRASRFSVQLGFSFYKETARQLTHVVLTGMTALDMLDDLSVERIYNEFVRGLSYDPVEFIRSLDSIKALDKILPELKLLFDCPEKEIYHWTGNTWKHIEEALKQVKDQPIDIILATLFHDLYKGICQKQNFARQKSDEYIRHDSSAAVEYFYIVADRWKFPTDIKELCGRAITTHMLAWTPFNGNCKTQTWYKFCKKISNGFRKDYNDNVLKLIKVIQADGLSDHVGRTKEQANALEHLIIHSLNTCYSISVADFDEKEMKYFFGLDGDEKGKYIGQKRYEKLDKEIGPILQQVKEGNFVFLEKIIGQKL